MQQVFLSSHGSKTRVWEEVRAILTGLPGKDGELLFPDGINSVKTLQTRLEVLLKWIKKRRDSAESRSGTDDEVHSEFIALLENLLEQWESVVVETADKAEKVSKLNAKKSSEAEVLRLAAMNSAAGRKRLLEVQQEEQRKKGGVGGTPRSAGSFSSVSSYSPVPSDSASSIQLMVNGLSEQSHSRAEIIAADRAEREKKFAAREERKKSRLEKKLLQQEQAMKAQEQASKQQDAMMAMFQQQQAFMMQQQQDKKDSNELKDVIVEMMKQQMEMMKDIKDGLVKK